MKVKAHIDQEKCEECGKCVEVCPIDLWELPKGKKPRFSGEEKCMLCYFCETECPKSAIKIEQTED